MESSDDKEKKNVLSNLNETKESKREKNIDLENLYDTKILRVYPNLYTNFKNKSNNNDETTELNFLNNRRNCLEIKKVYCNQDKPIRGRIPNDKIDSTGIKQCKLIEGTNGNKSLTTFDKSYFSKADIYSQVPKTKFEYSKEEKIKTLSTLPSKVRKRKHNIERFRKANIEYTDLHQTQKFNALNLNQATLFNGARRSDIITRSGKVANIIGRFEKCAMQEKAN